MEYIKRCNKTTVVDNGKVIGVGMHNELLKNNKVYKTLYEDELSIIQENVSKIFKHKREVNLAFIMSNNVDNVLFVIAF